MISLHEKELECAEFYYIHMVNSMISPNMSKEKNAPSRSEIMPYFIIVEIDFKRMTVIKYIEQ